MPKLSKADQAAKVSATEARRRKELALARLRELELAQKAGMLLPASEVRDRWVTILTAIKTAVLRLPDKLAPQTVAAADVREAHTILAAECEAILRELSDDIAYHAG
jgi:hypothetical protein